MNRCFSVKLLLKLKGKGSYYYRLKPTEPQGDKAGGVSDGAEAEARAGGGGGGAGPRRNVPRRLRLHRSPRRPGPPSRGRALPQRFATLLALGVSPAVRLDFWGSVDAGVEAEAGADGGPRRGDAPGHHRREALQAVLAPGAPPEEVLAGAVHALAVHLELRLGQVERRRQLQFRETTAFCRYGFNPTLLIEAATMIVIFVLAGHSR